MNGTELVSGRGRDGLAGTIPVRNVSAGEAFVLRSTVGRLVELQVFELGQVHDVGAMNAAVVAAISELGAPAILVADHRAVRPFPHDAGDTLARGMRLANTLFVRSGILLDPSNETFNLQLARVVRCAGSPRRRCFYDPFELRGWLGDVLTHGELARLDALFG